MTSEKISNCELSHTGDRTIGIIVCHSIPGAAAMSYTPSENISVTLACALVVALYAGKRYNTPETNRFSTTRGLFLFTGAGYTAASLAFFPPF